MLSIRLSRIGKKHQPSYRLVVAERRSKLTGIPTEDLGWFNPGLKKNQFNAERIKYWMSKGATVSGTVTNLLIDAKILTGKKIPMHNQPKKKEGDAAKPAAAPASAEATAGKPAEAKA